MRARHLMAMVLVTSMSLAPASLLAQTPPDSPMAAPAPDTEGLAPEPVIKEDLFTVTPDLEIDLTEEAAPITLSFAGQPNTQEVLNLDGIAAQGFTRTVTVNGEEISQVVVTKLTKEENAVDLTADEFTSQFASDSKRLVPTTSISVNGDEEEFVAAVKALADEEEEEDDDNRPTDQGTLTEGADGSNGSNGGDRDEGNGYETPKRLEAKEKEDKPEPVIEVRTTKEGCSPVVDLIQGVVKGQSKTQTYTDGALTDEDTCSDDGINFSIKQNYNVCDDVVDIGTMKANPQYIAYYINDVGERIEVSDCMVDEDRTFAIKESDNCPVTVDIEARQAIVNTSLIYLNGSGEEVTVRDCMPSDSYKPIPVKEDGSTCSLRHDFPGGKSYEMVMYYYEKDGLRYQATPCMDSGATYDHTKVFEKDGVRVCTMVINRSAGTATPQYRTEITVDGVSQVIGECRPEASSAVGIYSTTEGCDNPAQFTHDLAAGVSYGLERFYYDAGGSEGRVYLSECTKSTKTYRHSVSPSGWRNNDSARTAQQLVTISINVNGRRYQIASNYLAPGTTAVSYTSQGTSDTRDEGAAYYEGCNKFIPTKRSEKYRRPDGSIYSIARGAGKTIDDGDKCGRSTESKSEVTKAVLSVDTNGGGWGNVVWKDGSRSDRIGSGTFTNKSKIPAQSVSYRLSCPFNYGETHTVNVRLTTYNGRYERTKTTYPGGKVEYSNWVLKSESPAGSLTSSGSKTGGQGSCYDSNNHSGKG